MEPVKGVWSWSRDPLNFDAPNDISGTVEDRIVKFCTHVDYQMLAYGDKSPLKGVWSELRDPFLHFCQLSCL